MGIVFILFVIWLIVVSAVAFCEAPRESRDVLCFLAMIVVSVAIVLVFIVKGF
jgi:hypothetical protein